MEYSAIIPCGGIGSRLNLGYNKILYKYLRGLHNFANKSGLKIEETSKLVYHSENMIFGDVKAHQKIIDLFKTKEQRITELNTATIMALKKQRGE